MNTPFFIIRLKPDLSLDDCVEFINSLTEQGERRFKNLMVALPLIRLQEMTSRFPESGIHFGADQLFSTDPSSFTQPVASRLVLEAKGSFVLIGIPEEKNLFKLSLEQFKSKILSAQQADLKPIFCIQEQSEEEEIQFLKESGYFEFEDPLLIYQPDFQKFRAYLPSLDEIKIYHDKAVAFAKARWLISLPFDLLGFSSVIEELPFDGAFFTKSGVYPHAVHQESLRLFHVHNSPYANKE